MAQGALQGNLVYSTGYPFALSFALRPLQGLWATAPDLAYRLVLVMQYACGVVAVLMLYDLLRRTAAPPRGAVRRLAGRPVAG